MRQISAKAARLKSRQKIIKEIGAHLDATAWGRGGQIMAGSHSGTRSDRRIVASWPGARPKQIKAGSRKLYDVLRAEMRREQEEAAQK